MITDTKTLQLDEVVMGANAYLENFLSSELKSAQAIHPDYAQLLNEILEYVKGGGKRIRPYITILAYIGYGGDNIQNILPVACAWELLHSALLVHDDIMDRDIMRHGKSNIAGKYQAIYSKLSSHDTDHYASSSALIAGDLLISASQNIVLQSELVAEQKIVVLSLLNQAMFDAAGGQLLDVETAIRNVTTTNPLLIAEHKTASYSFVYPLLCGAYLADADDAEQEKLRDLGNSLGIAYQLIDDLLGVFGDQDQTGKSTDGDIRERKHTILLQETFKKVSGPDLTFLTTFYSNTEAPSESEIVKVRSIMEDSGAKDQVREQAQALTKKAKQTITSLHVQPEYKQLFVELVEKLLKRKY